MLSKWGHPRWSNDVVAIFRKNPMDPSSSTNAYKCASSTMWLVNLHWLRVPERIQYNLCVLVHRCLNGAAPQYLSELIQPLSDVDSRRRLRSASTAEVLVPATQRSTIGDHALAVAGPRAWNSLPVDLRLSGTFSTFKTHLKSYLFNISFPSLWLYHWLFLYRALEPACAAYAYVSLNLSLLHYILITCTDSLHGFRKRRSCLTNF